MFLKKLSPVLLKRTANLGLEQASPLQKKLVAGIKSGRDLMAFAPAGAGKSTAIALSLLQVLQAAEGDTPRALVLTHTDEGVLYFSGMLELLGAETGLRIVPATEKGNILEQKDKIYFGSDIVIGTPKRVHELLSIEGINLISMRMLVVHKANKVLRNQLLTMVYRVSESFPKAQVLLSGETKGTYESRYAEQFMKAPMVLESKALLPKVVSLPLEEI